MSAIGTGEASARAGTLRMPRGVHFGAGASAQVPRLLAEHGSRAFAVVDPFLASTDAFVTLARAVEAEGVELVVHTGVMPELPVDSVAAAAEEASACAPDVILGYGGGSAIDAAKLVALLVTHGGSPLDFVGDRGVPGPVLPVVAVPTTAGTGSEVTPVAVVTDPSQEMKVGISSHHLIPSIAVVDPDLTLGAPPSVTAFAGIDALVHAIESYTAGRLASDWSGPIPGFTGSNALADPLALEAMRAIGPSLAAAVADGGDRDARTRMAMGSLLAGMAFGPTGTHLSHALQYPIGAITKTPHGLGTGLMLPYVMRACAAALPERMRAIGVAIGGGQPANQSASAADAVERVAALCGAIGIPRTLADIGVTRAQLPRIAELAMRAERLVSIAPIEVDRAVLLAILEEAFDGELRD